MSHAARSFTRRQFGRARQIETRSLPFTRWLMRCLHPQPPHVLAATLLALLAGAADSQAQTRLLVPLYSYPCPVGDPCMYGPEGQYRDEGIAFWSKVAGAERAGVGTVAIVNVDDGPGEPADVPGYQAGIDSLVAAGVPHVGYVETDYAVRDAAVVRAEIDAWVALYPTVTGIFFDEASPFPADSTYHDDLCAYAVGRGLDPALTIVNPGDQPRPGWSTTCGVLVAFEDSLAAWPGAPPLRDEVLALGPDRLAAIVHTAGGDALTATLVEAAERGYGLVYVTDDAEVNPAQTDTNPYNTSPSYWAEEVAAVAQANTDGPAAPPIVTLTLWTSPNPAPAGGPLAFALTVPSPSAVRIEVSDALGRLVAVVHDGPLGAGAHRLSWPAAVAPGVYVITASSHLGRVSRRVVVMQ